MGGEHWELYLQCCIELNMPPDDRAIPDEVKEQRKQVFLEHEFVFIPIQ
jgi:hypothetical protein